MAAEKDHLRVLRLLASEPAVEEEGRELKSIRPLVHAGLAVEGQWYRQSHEGRAFRWRNVSITPAGRRALESSNAK